MLHPTIPDQPKSHGVRLIDSSTKKSWSVPPRYWRSATVIRRPYLTSKEVEDLLLPELILARNLTLDRGFRKVLSGTIDFLLDCKDIFIIEEE